MLKELVYKIINKNMTEVPESVLEDFRIFLRRNYIPEDYGELQASVVDLEDTLEFDMPESIDEPIEEYQRYISPQSIRSNWEKPQTSYDAAPKALSRRRGIPIPSIDIGYGRKQNEETDDLQRLVSNIGMTFQQVLLQIIDRKGFTDSQVYRRANLNRKLFSKIRCNENYKPSKLTAFALAIALELNLDEATDLLGRAGIALSPSDLTDLIVKYCLTHKIYDIYEVNALLYEYDQQLLGC